MKRAILIVFLFAVVFINGCTTTENNPVSVQNDSTLIERRISITNASSASSSVTIRNLGNSSIPLSEISVYVNDVLQTQGIWTGENNLQPGALAIYDWSPQECAEASIIRVETVGSAVTALCPKIVVKTEKKFVIESYTRSSVSIRNIGNSTIQTSDVSVYVDGNLTRCDWSSPTLLPYTLRMCIFWGTECNYNINVVSQDTSAQITC